MIDVLKLAKVFYCTLAGLTMKNLISRLIHIMLNLIQKLRIMPPSSDAQEKHR